ncbi:MULTISPECIES: hypothetical protein [unclassified Shewanella]|uniref:hypothetical protein n=1 Tax=Shewanella TaxID=22 RepID=UPI0021DA796E|nr:MULTISPECIES: hypothetical protein [unclassified Shewanella]MCU8036732.1 hypothetical protein [Shewanella sp. SM71]MCU8098219.1 hypothetical protein [Shewanella sp. SM102]
MNKKIIVTLAYHPLDATKQVFLSQFEGGKLQCQCAAELNKKSACRDIVPDRGRYAIEQT